MVAPLIWEDTTAFRFLRVFESGRQFSYLSAFDKAEFLKKVEPRYNEV